MTEFPMIYKEKLQREIEATPEEYWPALLNIIRSYRQSVTLNPADVSFRQGWQEAMNEELLPLSELWEDIDAS